MGDNRPPCVVVVAVVVALAPVFASAEMGRERGVSEYDGSQMRASELGSGDGLRENMPPLLPLSESGSLLRLERLLVLKVLLGGGLEL